VTPAAVTGDAMRSCTERCWANTELETYSEGSIPPTIWDEVLNGTGEFRVEEYRSWALPTSYYGVHSVDNWSITLVPDCIHGPAEPFTFVRGKGRPKLESATWSSCGGAGFLKVACDHISSAWVYLNGGLVLSPSDFNPRVEELSVPVELLQGDNTIEVQLAGQPGSNMTIDFEQ